MRIRSTRSRGGWGHSSVGDTLAFALRSQAERLLLFHHDPSHGDTQLESLEEEATEESARRRLDGSVELAREGACFDLR